MKYLITISYDGSKYDGLQKLKNGKTVQGELESILSRCNESPVKVISSGRTDKGVHALNQVCTFNLNKEIDPYKLKGYINRSTSPALFVNSCEIINDEQFHARFSVKSKTYKYVINTGSYNPIENNYKYNFNKPLDTEKMSAISKLLIGTHNYHAFIVGKHNTYESTIYSIDITKDKTDVIIRIKGSAFYTYMVRNIVKVLILASNNIISEDDINCMLKTGKKIVEYSPAPPGGLYLETVEY